ncbi:hypothetical protein M407DRAFT_20361 [Tulasnella calospora MUT 4182]|uniref:WW domain-containing protein n=1 Tax=Tulasnella calospora MUT 4182 TaxID=1051891 RepID=A0A0C3QQA1_9AGAM|nr:hypothetical protein M407DRAFT_20361 [Tulasnella calospora MUT 4182]
MSDGWTIIDNQGEFATAWDSHVTPEGDSYWCDCDRKIISHADPHQPVVANLINTAYEKIRNNIRDWDNVEVFFNTSQEAPETPTSGALEYYFINHSTRQVFWIEDVKAERLGIGPVTSPRQLRSALVPEYWTHVDYFPCHHPVNDDATEELLNVLRHGAIDDMTAPGSTFPYSAKECRQYLSLFEGFKNSSGVASRSAFKTASIARVWSSITRVRHINGYGLKHPRLDRLQGLGDYSSMQARRSLKWRVIELGCFDMSRGLFGRMTALWNGRIVYQRHWHTLFDELRREWELMALINVVMLMASIALLLKTQANLFILKSLVASTAGAGVVLSLLLHRVHQRSGLATASDISAYISYAENYYHGLRGLSIVLSLPRVLSLWGMILLQVTLAMELSPDDPKEYQWDKWAAIGAVPATVLLPALAFFRNPA